MEERPDFDSWSNLKAGCATPAIPATVDDEVGGSGAGGWPEQQCKTQSERVGIGGT